MKKVLLLSFILGVFTQSSLFADVKPVKKKMGEKWGIKLGFGRSSFSGTFQKLSDTSTVKYSNVSDSSGSPTGISLGLISPYLSFNDQFSVHGEVLLVSRGYEHTWKGYVSSGGYTYPFSSYQEVIANYLQIPLFLNYQFSKEYGFRGYLGPYVALELSNQAKVEANVSYASVSENGEATNTNDFGFGLATGLSYEWEKFSADLRYETSLTDFFGNMNGKISMLSVSGSYLF